MMNPSQSQPAARASLLVSCVLALCIAALPACTSKTKSKDNVAIPKALTKLEQKVELQKVWSVGISSDNAVRGEHLGPSVVGDSVYAAGSRELMAIAKDSGKVLWRVKGKELWSAGPSSDGKRVVLASLDGKVACYDANDGEALWSIEVSSEVLAAPILAEDKVLIRSNDGRVHALEASTGKIAWRFDRDVPLLSLRGAGAPKLDNGLLYVPADSGKVAALRISDGVVVWEESANISNGRNELERLADIDGDIAIDNGDLFVAGYHGQTSALAASSGATLWTYQGPSVEGLTLDKRNLYLSDAESRVVALDRRSGAEVWKQEALLNRLISSPAVLGEYAVVGDLEGYLHVLDVNSGALVGRARQGKLGFPQSPVVADDVMYAQSANGTLSAYRLR